MRKITLFFLLIVIFAAYHLSASPAFAIEDIPLVPQWQISGSIFADRDGDRIKDENEAAFTGKPVITIQGRSPINSTISLSQSQNASGNLVLNNDGTFSARRLLPGEYDVTYTPPTGVTISPSTYRVTVGDGQPPFGTYQCTNAAVSPGVAGVNYCQTIGSVTGNVTNLGFAVSASDPWLRSYGLDMRFGNGITNSVPSSACDGGYASIPSSVSATGFSSSITPGILIAGDGKPLEFTPGQASAYDWKVSDTYVPIKSGNLVTSYTTILANAKKAGITPIELIGQSGCPSTTACAPQNLTSGVYKANGNLTLANWTVANGSNYVLLVDGNLTLSGKTQVGNTDASLVIIVSGDITVANTIGQSSPYSCPAYNTTDIDGFFSTDQNFIIDSTNDCATEKTLSIGGGIVINAGYTGGQLDNRRNLCNSNAQYPTFSLRARPDMLLALPDIAKSANQTYQEVAP